MSDKATDHVELGLSRLIDQFSESAKFRAWLASYLGRVQEFENEYHPLIGERSLDSATGDRLDAIGQILKVKRGGRTDSVYRDVLETEILVLGSQGTWEELLTLLRRLTTAPSFSFTEVLPKTVYATPTGNHILVEDPQLIANTLRRSVSAATHVLFVYQLVDDAELYLSSSQMTGQESSVAIGLANWTVAGEWNYESLGTSPAGIIADELRFNTANPQEATEMYVHRLPISGINQNAFLGGLADYGVFLHVFGENGGWMYIDVGATSLAGDVWTLEVTVQNAAGVFSDFENLELVATYDGGALAGAA